MTALRARLTDVLHTELQVSPPNVELQAGLLKKKQAGECKKVNGNLESHHVYDEQDVQEQIEHLCSSHREDLTSVRELCMKKTQEV